MKSLLVVFGRKVELRAVLPGAAIATAVSLIAGVGLGSLVAERSTGAFALNGVLFAGLMSGGAVAAARSRTNPLTAAIMTSIPAMVIAVAVQGVRRFGSGESIEALGLPLAMLLSASLATLGGVLAVRLRRKNRSLLN